MDVHTGILMVIIYVFSLLSRFSFLVFSDISETVVITRIFKL